MRPFFPGALAFALLLAILIASPSHGMNVDVSEVWDNLGLSKEKYDSEYLPIKNSLRANDVMVDQKRITDGMAYSDAVVNQIPKLKEAVQSLERSIEQDFASIDKHSARKNEKKSEDKKKEIDPNYGDNNGNIIDEAALHGDCKIPQLHSHDILTDLDKGNMKETVLSDPKSDEVGQQQAYFVQMVRRDCLQNNLNAQDKRAAAKSILDAITPKDQGVPAPTGAGVIWNMQSSNEWREGFKNQPSKKGVRQRSTQQYTFLFPTKGQEEQVLCASVAHKTSVQFWRSLVRWTSQNSFMVVHSVFSFRNGDNIDLMVATNLPTKKIGNIYSVKFKHVNVNENRVQIANPQRNHNQCLYYRFMEETLLEAPAFPKTNAQNLYQRTLFTGLTGLNYHVPPYSVEEGPRREFYEGRDAAKASLVTSLMPLIFPIATSHSSRPSLFRTEKFTRVLKDLPKPMKDVIQVDAENGCDFVPHHDQRNHFKDLFESARQDVAVSPEEKALLERLVRESYVSAVPENLIERAAPAFKGKFNFRPSTTIRVSKLMGCGPSHVHSFSTGFTSVSSKAHYTRLELTSAVTKMGVKLVYQDRTHKKNFLLFARDDLNVVWGVDPTKLEQGVYYRLRGMVMDANRHLSLYDSNEHTNCIVFAYGLHENSISEWYSRYKDHFHTVITSAMYAWFAIIHETIIGHIPMKNNLKAYYSHLYRKHLERGVSGISLLSSNNVEVVVPTKENKVGFEKVVFDYHSADNVYLENKVYLSVTKPVDRLHTYKDYKERLNRLLFMDVTVFQSGSQAKPQVIVASLHHEFHSNRQEEIGDEVRHDQDADISDPYILIETLFDYKDSHYYQGKHGKHSWYGVVRLLDLLPHVAGKDNEKVTVKMHPNPYTNPEHGQNIQPHSIVLGIFPTHQNFFTYAKIEEDRRPDEVLALVDRERSGSIVMRNRKDAGYTVCDSYSSHAIVAHNNQEKITPPSTYNTVKNFQFKSLIAPCAMPNIVEPPKDVKKNSLVDYLLSIGGEPDRQKENFGFQGISNAMEDGMDSTVLFFRESDSIIGPDDHVNKKRIGLYLSRCDVKVGTMSKIFIKLKLKHQPGDVCVSIFIEKSENEDWNNLVVTSYERKMYRWYTYHLVDANTDQKDPKYCYYISFNHLALPGNILYKSVPYDGYRLEVLKSVNQKENQDTTLTGALKAINVRMFVAPCHVFETCRAGKKKEDCEYFCEFDNGFFTKSCRPSTDMNKWTPTPIKKDSKLYDFLFVNTESYRVEAKHGLNTAPFPYFERAESTASQDMQLSFNIAMCEDGKNNAKAGVNMQDGVKNCLVVSYSNQPMENGVMPVKTFGLLSHMLIPVNDRKTRRWYRFKFFTDAQNVEVAKVEQHCIWTRFFS